MSELRQVGHHDKNSVLYWSVVETIYFDDGQVYGRVRFVGTEEECDKWASLHGKDQFMHLEWPSGFGKAQVMSVMLNIIATNKPCRIYGMGDSNVIGRS